MLKYHAIVLFQKISAVNLLLSTLSLRSSRACIIKKRRRQRWPANIPKRINQILENTIKNPVAMPPHLRYKLARYTGFHLATKIWGGSALNEWAYLAHQVPWDVFLGEFL